MQVVAIAIILLWGQLNLWLWRHRVWADPLSQVWEDHTHAVHTVGTAEGSLKSTALCLTTDTPGWVTTPPQGQGVGTTVKFYFNPLAKHRLSTELDKNTGSKRERGGFRPSSAPFSRTKGVWREPSDKSRPFLGALCSFSRTAGVEGVALETCTFWWHNIAFRTNEPSPLGGPGDGKTKSSTFAVWGALRVHSFRSQCFFTSSGRGGFLFRWGFRVILWRAHPWQ